MTVRGVESGDERVCGCGRQKKAAGPESGRQEQGSRLGVGAASPGWERQHCY